MSHLYEPTPLPVFENTIDFETTTYWYPIIEYWNVLFPDKPAGQIKPPFYFTIDMGKKATYSRFRWTGDKRLTPSRNFHYNAPQIFNIWGCNNPKLIADVEDPNGIYPKGSRQANQAYWSSWPAANGTDAWKEDGWVLLAQCQWIMSDGTLAQYVPNLVMNAEDWAKYTMEGYEFEFNQDVFEAYRYLRFEILKTVRIDGSYAMEFVISGLRFWGAFPD